MFPHARCLEKRLFIEVLWAAASSCDEYLSTQKRPSLTRTWGASTTHEPGEMRPCGGVPMVQIIEAVTERGVHRCTLMHVAALHSASRP